MAQGLTPTVLRRARLGVAGNILEWFDFSVFGALTAVIADVFFSKEASRSERVFFALAEFAGAFFMRPVAGGGTDNGL